jgi:5-formyltetrahydrofolate cyclo-ligase
MNPQNDSPPPHANVAVPRTPSDLKSWRKAERERLIAERLAIDPDERRKHADRIAAHLDEIARPIAGRTISVYWPLRGEPDLRPWMEHVVASGGVCALPVVVVRNAPLIFRAWTPAARMERGFWNIPVPADGAEVLPDFIIAPVVGFDPRCYRLGYGGGYFDRTLASLTGRRRVVGVGYAQTAIATIHPQPHDIAMDAIVTENGTLWS